MTLRSVNKLLNVLYRGKDSLDIRILRRDLPSNGRASHLFFVLVYT